MLNQELPASFNHLEVQLTALLQRSMADDVPTDVHRQIRDAFAKMNELKGVLSVQAPKKSPLRRK